MVSDSVSRRSVIERGILLMPALALLPNVARAAAACADPNESLHQSLHYTEESPDAQKTCTTCGFFSADGEKGCGSCKIFNGPTSPKGHCDSWAAKE
jgi:hypothetical protein